MGNAQDPRHVRRRILIQQLFAWDFHHALAHEEPDANTRIRSILKNIKKIDPLIAKTAPEWPLTQLNKIDLAILRLAIYELLIEKQHPPKVIIDEAVELAKEFGNDKSHAFVNGVLGTIIRKVA